MFMEGLGLGRACAAERRALACRLPSSPARLLLWTNLSGRRSAQRRPLGTVEVLGGPPAEVALVTILHRLHGDAQRLHRV